jgi:hypothetical protein
MPHTLEVCVDIQIRNYGPEWLGPSTRRQGRAPQRPTPRPGLGVRRLATAPLSQHGFAEALAIQRVAGAAS